LGETTHLGNSWPGEARSAFLHSEYHNLNLKPKERQINTELGKELTRWGG